MPTRPDFKTIPLEFNIIDAVGSLVELGAGGGTEVGVLLEVDT